MRVLRFGMNSKKEDTKNTECIYDCGLQAQLSVGSFGTKGAKGMGREGKHCTTRHTQHVEIGPNLRTSRVARHLLYCETFTLVKM